jgi:hypothetical protein
MGIVSAAFYLIFTLISANLLNALIGSIGLMIAFYYGLTGFACVWYYRRTLTKNFRDFVMRGLFPFLGGAMLLGVFIYGLIQFAAPDWLTDDDGHNVTIFGIGAEAVVGVGGLLLGVVLMLVYWAVRPDFFRGTTLPRRSDGPGLAPPGEEPPADPTQSRGPLLLNPRGMLPARRGGHGYPARGSLPSRARRGTPRPR